MIIIHLPDDPTYKQLRGSQLLTIVLERLANRGYRTGELDKIKALYAAQYDLPYISTDTYSNILPSHDIATISGLRAAADAIRASEGDFSPAYKRLLYDYFNAICDKESDRETVPF